MPLSMILDIASSCSDFLPVLVAIYNFKYLDKVLKITAVFFLIESMVGLAMWISTHMGVKNNMPLIHVNLIITILFFGIIYYKLFLKSGLKKTVVVLSSIVLLITLYYNLHIYEYPSVPKTALSILLIVLSLIYFYQMLNPLKYVDIEKQGLFWINAGVLFYFAVNIFLFMIFTQIPVKEQGNYYIINSVTNIIANILYSVGLFCKPQKTT